MNCRSAALPDIVKRPLNTRVEISSRFGVEARASDIFQYRSGASHCIRKTSKMTLEIAKARRVQALSKRSEDRTLIAPAPDFSQVKMPDQGTVAGYLIEALGQGADMAELVAETGWSKSCLLINLYKLARKTGVGISRRDHTLHLMLPSGSDKTFPRAKVVNDVETVKSGATDIIDAQILVA